MTGNNSPAFYDNSNGLPSKQAINLMKYYFLTKLPAFKFIREYYDPHGYWGAYFSNGEMTIFLGEERSFLDYSVEANGTKFALSQFDERVTLLERTSKKNLHFLLDTIKQYLKSMDK